MSAAEERSSIHEFSRDLHEIAGSNTSGFHVNDLGDCLAEVLNIQGTNHKNGKASKEDGYKDSFDDELKIYKVGKCLSKRATFPCSRNGLSISSADILNANEGLKDDISAEKLPQSGYVQTPNSSYSRSISFPTSSKLVSAMKGSREKLGASLRKLTVTWAPDVYDPPPTSVSHMPNKPQRNRNDSKKNGKNKHKGGGKGSRTIKGKDRKQSRKHGGSSSRCPKPLENEVRVSSESQIDPIEFDVGSPDPFCGHTFLKKSVTQMHFPVAEAT